MKNEPCAFYFVYLSTINTILALDPPLQAHLYVRWRRNHSHPIINLRAENFMLKTSLLCSMMQVQKSERMYSILKSCAFFFWSSRFENYDIDQSWMIRLSPSACTACGTTFGSAVVPYFFGVWGSSLGIAVRVPSHHKWWTTGLILRFGAHIRLLFWSTCCTRENSRLCNRFQHDLVRVTECNFEYYSSWCHTTKRSISLFPLRADLSHDHSSRLGSPCAKRSSSHSTPTIVCSTSFIRNADWPKARSATHSLSKTVQKQCHWL